VTGRRPLERDLAWGPSGLVPAIVQDVADGRVLMLAYMDAEALAATLAVGEVHFHSRSRDRLWRKGETSGNVLRLRDVELDCDGDALLLQVEPAGPTCHRSTRSCFDPADSAPGPLGEPGTASRPAANEAPRSPVVPPPAQGFAWLETLWATIDGRAGADPAASYTARLLLGGVDATARKVAEEATEVVMAAKDDAVAPADSRAATGAALAGEVADLLYHTLVLLRERGLPPAAVIARLRERHTG
jgi:phosphoribosyl-AMP cyclohydrolase / phosphoribosyl-ATP pyrophosphohydrolase